MPRPSRRVAVALSLVVGLSALARAPEAEAQRAAQRSGGTQSLITTGRQQYDDLQYEEAVQSLSAALIRGVDAPEQERDIFELLGLSYLALSRNEEAEGAFRRLLARVPTHQLAPSLAPRVRSFFDDVRRRWEAAGRPGLVQANRPPEVQQPVTIEHRSPAEHTRFTDLTLEASMTDPGRRAAGLVLAWRPGSVGLFRRQPTAPAGPGFAARIPGESVAPPVLEYYFEAVDPNGLAVAARGDAFAPLRVVVPEAPRASITSRWWFWTGAAVLVAGAVVGTYFLVADDGGTAPAPAQLRINVAGD